MHYLQYHPLTRTTAFHIMQTCVFGWDVFNQQKKVQGKTRVLGVIKLSGEAIHHFNPPWRFLSDYLPFPTSLMCRSRALGPGGTTPAMPELWTMPLYGDVYLSILHFRETCMFCQGTDTLSACPCLLP